MSAIDAGVVFLPRFTTLVGATTFRTAPLDVSRQGGVQFQVWRGPIRTTSGQGALTLELEESFDAETWSLGATPTAPAITIEAGLPHFFSYSFRLRWFRLKLVLTGTGAMVSCWAEGLLRGGGEGMWGGMAYGPQSAVGAGATMGHRLPSDLPGKEWWRVSPPTGVGADLLYQSDPAYRAWVDSEREKQDRAAVLAGMQQYAPPPPGSVPGSWAIGPGSKGPFPGPNPGVSNPFGP